ALEEFMVGSLVRGRLVAVSHELNPTVKVRRGQRLPANAWLSTDGSRAAGSVRRGSGAGSLTRRLGAMPLVPIAGIAAGIVIGSRLRRRWGRQAEDGVSEELQQDRKAGEHHRHEHER